MDHIIIDAGTLEFSDADLTATGLLVPYGVPARSNLGTFTFAAGDIELPSDLTGMSLNIEHKRERVVGAFTRVWEQATGIFAAFKFADTKPGREAYAEAKSGTRKNLSAEVADVRIQGGKALPGASLFAGALVEHPAFEGATLLAAEDTETVHYEDTYTDDNGVTWKRVTDTTTTTSTTTEPAAEAPADDTEEEESTTLNASNPAGAKVPATLMGGAPSAPAAADAEPIDLGAIFAAMAQLKTGMKVPEAETLLAALSDIKYSGAGAIAGAGVLQPAWVGRLWQGRRYARRYMDLANHTFGGIQLGGRKGFKLDQGTALVTQWAGNKAAAGIGSGVATTSVTGSSIQPYGYAADVAREWSDLEGGAEVLQAFFEGVIDSYAQVTDLDALAAIFTAATKTAAALDRLVAPDDYPAVGDYAFPDALGMLIQGTEAIEDASDTPTYALVNPVAWKQLLYTPKSAIPEFVAFTADAGGDGSTEGVNGKVLVRKAPASAFVGMVATDPQVIVGAKNAIEFREQGETPIQVDALDIAKGGIDRAVIGYVETFVVRPESLVAIGTKAA